MSVDAAPGRSIFLRLRALIAIGVVCAFTPDLSAQTGCSREPLAVQVLGSGGPFTGGTRASTGYLVWRGGRAVVMVDVGGGTFLRFGEAGASLRDLELLAISHVHPDHVSDLPALLWLSEQARQQSLKIVGPSGAGAFPSIDTFVSRLFDTSSGAFPILAGTLGQSGQGVRLDVVAVDATTGTSSKVWSDAEIEVSAFGVPHGNVPSLAYRITIGDRTVVFASDQNGSDERFSTFAAGADVLVMHLAVSQQAAGPITQLHAKPATIGQIAQRAKVKHLVLSHLIQAPSSHKTPELFSLFDLDQAVGEVRRYFSGPIDAAVDLQCIPIR